MPPAKSRARHLHCNRLRARVCGCNKLHRHRQQQGRASATTMDWNFKHSDLRNVAISESHIRTQPQAGRINCTISPLPLSQSPAFFARARGIPGAERWSEGGANTQKRCYRAEETHLFQLIKAFAVSVAHVVTKFGNFLFNCLFGLTCKNGVNEEQGKNIIEKREPSNSLQPKIALRSR